METKWTGGGCSCKAKGIGCMHTGPSAFTMKSGGPSLAKAKKAADAEEKKKKKGGKYGGQQR